MPIVGGQDRERLAIFDADHATGDAVPGRDHADPVDANAAKSASAARTAAIHPISRTPCGPEIVRSRIAQATPEDSDGILDLQERNLPHRGGTLSARLPQEWRAAAVADMAVFVAKKGRRVVGHLISASRQAYAGVPMAEAMLRACNAAPSAPSAAPRAPKPTTMPRHA